MRLLNNPMRKVVPSTCLTLAIALVAAGSLTAPAFAQIGENVRNGDFSAGTAQWFTTGNLTPTIVDGRLCVDVPGGTVNPWDAIIGQNDIALLQGVTYTYSYEISSSVAGRNARALVGLSVAPFDAYFVANEQLATTDTLSASHAFVQTTSTDVGQVAFQIGGSPDPWTFCVDNVSLAGGAAPEPYVPDTGPRVRVNQVGYLPEGPKGATLVTDATEPLAWELKNASGQVVKSGCYVAGWDRHHVGAERPRDRVQPLQASRRGLHARRRRRHEPPVRHLVDGIRRFAGRRVVALLPAAQRHSDPR